MRLSQPIEKHGFFWLPGDTKNQVPGILRISESGDITLEVICFSDPDFGPYVFKERRLEDIPDEDMPDEDITTSIDRIVGITDDGLITLDGCSYGDPLGHWLGETSTSIIHAHFAFMGFHFAEGEEFTLSKLKFSVEGLDEWMEISGICRDYNEKSASIHFRHPEEIALNLPDGIELRFTFQANAIGRFYPPVTEAGITQKAYISLTSKKLRPLEDFLELVFKLQKFLCFAIDEIVYIDSVVGYITKDGYEPSIEIYYQSMPHSIMRPNISQNGLLFNYQNVANQLEKFLTEWIKNYEISEPAFNLYFSNSSDNHIYLDKEFLSLAQGIETLHRRNSQETQMPEDEFNNLVTKILEAIPDEKQKNWIEEKLKYANELSLRKRMKQMIEPFKDLFGNAKERNSFIRKVVDTRNYFTHYDRRLENEAPSGKKSGDLEKLDRLHLKLKALLQLHFLKLIGMDIKSIKSIANENYAFRNKLGRE